MMKETVLSRAVRLSFSGTLVAAGLLATPAMAQNAGEAIQRVEITGSSIKRLASETVLPVTVIRQEDIVRAGGAAEPSDAE